MQNGFWVVPKTTFANSCQQIYDVIIPVSSGLLILEIVERKRKKITKNWISREQKIFLDKRKSIFHNFWTFFQGAVSFHPSVGTRNQPNPWNCILFYPFGGFRGSCKPSSPESQSILCECKQTWKLLVKDKSDLFVNKQIFVQHKREFWEGER